MTQQFTPEEMLTQLGLVLPQLPAPGGNYVSALVRVFGEAGRHVRAAVGVSALPRNALVELQMTVRLKG